VADTEAIFERVIDAVVEATLIVIESQLHGDPVPSLRSHYKLITQERARLYDIYGYMRRLAVDAMLRERAVSALRYAMRDDTRLSSESPYRLLFDLLFCEGEWRPSEPETWALPDFNRMLVV